MKKYNNALVELRSIRESLRNAYIDRNLRDALNKLIDIIEDEIRYPSNFQGTHPNTQPHVYKEEFPNEPRDDSGTPIQKPCEIGDPIVNPFKVTCNNE